MQRRSFIGSIIGIITNLAVPFQAESAVFKTGSRLDRLKRMVRMFEVPEYLLQAFKCGLILDNDETIAMTYSCEISRDIEALTIQFRFYSVEVHVPINIKGIILIDDSGYEVMRKLCDTTCFVKGDTLRVHYNLDVKQMESQ